MKNPATNWNKAPMPKCHFPNPYTLKSYLQPQNPMRKTKCDYSHQHCVRDPFVTFKPNAFRLKLPIVVSVPHINFIPLFSKIKYLETREYRAYGQCGRTQYLSR